MTAGINQLKTTEDATGKRILLLRIEDRCELYNTDAALSSLRRAHPLAEIWTLSCPSVALHDVVKRDGRFDGVLSCRLPLPKAVIKDRSGLATLIRGGKFDEAYVCSAGSFGSHSELILLAADNVRKSNWLTLLGEPIPFDSPEGRRMVTKARLRRAEKIWRGAWTGLRTSIIENLAKLGKKDEGVTLPSCEKPFNVLWIPAEGLGDLIISFTALDAFMTAYPQARVDILTPDMHRSLVERLPLVHSVIAFEPPGRRVRHSKPTNIIDCASVIKLLKRNQYDLAVDLSGLDVVRLVTYFAGIPVRVGNREHGKDPWQVGWTPLMSFVPSSETFPDLITDRHRAVLSSLGVTWQGNRYPIEPSHEVTERVDSIIARHGIARRYAVFCPRSAVRTKYWNVERWCETADYLAERYDLDVILTGISSAAAYNEQIRQGASDRSRVHDLTGEVDLQELSELLRSAEIMVTLDSGPMHMAAALDVPLVSLYTHASVPSYPPAEQSDSILVATCDDLLEHSHGERIDSEIQMIPVRRVLDKIDEKLAPSQRVSVSDLQVV